jgi:hypothetical protein
MAAQGKGRKFGRHARNPSSKNQAYRSARNKAKNIAAAPKGSYMAEGGKAHPGATPRSVAEPKTPYTQVMRKERARHAAR